MLTATQKPESLQWTYSERHIEYVKQKQKERERQMTPKSTKRMRKKDRGGRLETGSEWNKK